MLINLRNALMAGERLPYDAEVEYLESTGTQWIDTGRPIPDDFWFDATIDITGTNNAYKTLLGARFASTVNDYQFSFQSSNNYFLARYGGGSQYYSPLQTGMTRIRVESGGKLYINESFVLQLGVSSPSAFNMYIFALNDRGAVSQQAQYIRLYSLKYGGVNEEHDYIPVRKGTVGYLYDRVSGKLFGNAGTGDFVLGPDVVPVEYLEGTGTQYIDTGLGYFADFDIGIKLRTSVSNKALGIASSGCMERFNSSQPVWVLSTAGYGQKVSNAIITDYHVMSWRSGVFAADGNFVVNVTNSFSLGTMTLFGAGGNFFPNMIYFCNLYTQTGDQVRNFLPVRVGTDATSWEGAMMDVLTRRIYRNAGTGAFSYGNDLKYPIPAS